MSINNMDEQTQIEELELILTNEQMEPFRKLYLDMHPHEQAQFFMKQTINGRLLIYYYLSPEEIAQLMEHIDLEETSVYFTEMDPQFASSVFASMPADDSVDILNE